MLYTCKCLNILVEADETKVQMNTSSVEENPQKYFTEVLLRELLEFMEYSRIVFLFFHFFRVLNR